MTPTPTVGDVGRMIPDLKQFRLVADDHVFEYEPGQYTLVRFETDGEEVRPHTAANLPDGSKDEIVLAIERHEGASGAPTRS